MGTRPPLRGFNHNIRYRDRVYHVQTEDSGLETPHVFTHMFLEGQIIASCRMDYDDLVVESEEQQKENDQKIRKMMQEQHKSLMKQLRRGEMDETIISLMGMLEPVVDEPPAGVEPAVAEVPAGMGPALAPVATEETPAAAMQDHAPEAATVAPPTLKEEGPPTLKEEGPPTLKEEGPPTLKEEGPPTLKEEGPPTLKEEGPPGEVEEPPPPAAAVAAEVAESTPPLAVEVVPSADQTVVPPTAVPAPPTRLPSRVPRPRPVVPEPQLSRPLDVRGLAQPRVGMPDVEVTQPVDVRALHGFDRHAADTALPLFPEADREVEVPVIADGPPQESVTGPLPASTYSHVYREDEPRRIATPVRHRVSMPLPQPPPIRRQSRVFGQPLPGSTRYPSSDELPSVGELPRKSGVYLVPGGPPQRPPHPDPAVRRQVRPQEPRARTSSPQRYTAPRRPPSQIPKPVPRRQTGAYEKPTSEETPRQRAKVDPKRSSSPQVPPVHVGPPVVPPPRPVTAPAMVQPESGTEQRQTGQSVSQASARLQQPTTLPRTGSHSQARAISSTERPPRPPSTPLPHVVARPVVVVGQPVKRPPRVPSPPVVTPPSVPRARPASKPFTRGGAQKPFTRGGAQEPSVTVEPSSVFGSDLISERSLDEVILAYLAEDNEGEK